MTTDNPSPAEPAPAPGSATRPTAADVAVYGSAELTAAVQEYLTRSPEEVRSRLIAQMTDREINRRVQQLEMGLARIQQMRADFGKLKPDQKIRDAAGTVLQEGYSEQKFQERKKLDMQLKQWENAFTEAATVGDFSQLDKLLGKGGD